MSSLDETLARSTPEPSLTAEKPIPAAETNRYVVFFLGGGQWAAPLEDVLEMATVPKITPLPHVPGFVSGVTNLRGEVLAVIDLRSVVGFDSPSDPARERLLVMKAPGREATGGFIVDGVRGLARVAPGDIAAPAWPAGEQAARFLRGVTGQDGALLNVLDTKTLFDSPEMLRLAAS
jgi:purine-binding chemotaxis protein CheW